MTAAGSSLAGLRYCQKCYQQTYLRENARLNARCALSYLKSTRDLNCLGNWGGKANSATGDKIEKARSKKNKGSLAGTLLVRRLGSAALKVEIFLFFLVGIF